MNLGKSHLLQLENAFPRFAWLLKMFNENTQDPKGRYYNKKLCCAKGVAENWYSMLKGRFRIIYKSCKCKLENEKYIVMACILQHNLCNAVAAPYLPRSKLQVEELDIIDKGFIREES